MGEPARGVAAMVAACTIWGLSALYYKLLDHIPPLEGDAEGGHHGLAYSVGYIKALLAALAAG